MTEIGTEGANVVVTFTSGGSALVMPRAPKPDVPEVIFDRTQTPGGVIYTDLRDMPSLEQLLNENRIASAVLEVSAPLAKRVSYIRVIAAASLAAGTLVGGLLAFIEAITPNVIDPNPYTALALALGGVVLMATLVVALYGPPREI